MFKTPRRISADTIPSLRPLRKFIFLYGNIAISSVAGDTCLGTVLGSWDTIVGVVLGSCPEDCEHIRCSAPFWTAQWLWYRLANLVYLDFCSV